MEKFGFGFPFRKNSNKICLKYTESGTTNSINMIKFMINYPLRDAIHAYSTNLAMENVTKVVSSH